ncbi:MULTISPECIES: glutathione S-transferase N-terminal domain-containing protein [unclassified Aureimonas]|uniref:glutathione S-transferase N-terminal domain-containing protein n=1 Tax=unclassified Aureimonas TaxID=2615206 RepID=UPI0006F68951|nr:MULTISPECIES: glutathione S-transferase N-terminal domain-containing protein [unclassified Aureimonas]KQT69621.1 glutathione S-transferase [Aureimonas sp. Leaf427]KQT80972.1 glutathione S-transferase [Aureimonas sp. Leaf460]
MADGTLFIGTRRYSSWSLRGWLAVQMAGLDVEITTFPLAGGATPEVKARTPAGFVPYLEHQGARIWDSLSIGEYCAEFAPGLWPEDRILRALLRSASAEMHSGFLPLRRTYPTIMGAVASPQARDAAANDEATADIARICALWAELLVATGGPYLNGAEAGIADAMFAPVATRIRTWGLDATDVAQGYIAAIHDHPLVKRWFAEAEAEPADWRREHYETRLG